MGLGVGDVVEGWGWGWGWGRRRPGRERVRCLVSLEGSRTSGRMPLHADFTSLAGIVMPGWR